MIAYLQKLCATAETPLMAQQYVREYLQARILQSLQRSGAMQSIAFHGGTALRFIYNLPRFSEDLDFALERAIEAYDFRSYLRQIERDFLAEAYELDFKISDQRTVHKAFVRFRGLLYELGLSGHQTEVLAVKLEIDTNPPQGAGLSTTTLNRHVPLNIHHHDRSSLFAGKLHAVLQRSYLKGRDIFDLWWYLTQPEWPEPNYELLNRALDQSNWIGPELSQKNWRDSVYQRLEQLDWQEAVLQDIRPFILSTDWEAQLTQPNVLGLLTRNL